MPAYDNIVDALRKSLPRDTFQDGTTAHELARILHGKTDFQQICNTIRACVPTSINNVEVAHAAHAVQSLVDVNAASVTNN